MTLTFDTGWLILALLAATRWAGLLLFTPVLSFNALPPQVRVALLAGFTFLTFAALGPDLAVAVDWSFGALVLAFLRELLLGAAMGFGVQCAFGAFSVGGRLLDYQMGFGIATLFDPTSQAFGSLMGTLLSMLGALMFLTLDAHHALLRGAIALFRIVPVGAAVDYRAGQLLGQFGLMLAYGFALVAPAVAGLMLVDIGIAVAARLMPQVNAYFVAIPVKVFVGLLFLALSLRYAEPFISELFAGVARRWQSILWVH